MFGYFIDLQRGNAGGADPFGVATGLLIALDDGDRQLPLECFDGTAEQAGLSRARAGHQIERENPLLVEAPAVLGCIAIVPGENVAFDLYQPRRRRCRLLRYRREVRMSVRMRVGSVVPMVMNVPLAIGMGMNLPMPSADSAVARLERNLPAALARRRNICRVRCPCLRVRGPCLAIDMDLAGATTASGTHLYAVSSLLFIRLPVPSPASRFPRSLEPGARRRLDKGRTEPRAALSYCN